VIRHLWSLVCAKSSIDSQTNNISIFEVIEQIQIGPIPESVPEGPVPLAAMSLEVISLWMRDPLNEPARGEYRITMHSPRGKSLPSAVQVMDLSTFRRFRSRFHLPGLPIDGVGLCQIEVEFRAGSEAEWVSVAKVPIEVAEPSPPNQ
jgi:hypothetical protein